jgi:hypothetical protein
MTGRAHLSRHLTLGLAATLVLLIQVLHPWAHPQEIVGADAADSLACPVSHAVGHVPLQERLPVVLAVVCQVVASPQVWLSHTAFLHPLAPRPPPEASR